jgi:hypothetical protein
MNWRIVTATARGLIEGPGPFVMTALVYDQWRLAWPRGAFGGSTQVSYWGTRYAVVVRGASFTVIDAHREIVAQLSVRGFRHVPKVAVVAGNDLWFPITTGHLVVPHADLARLFDFPAGAVELVIDDEPVHATLTYETPRDPMRELGAAVVPVERHADVAQLLERLADDPTDEPTRDVLLDMLADLGLPCASAFASLRSGHELTQLLQRSVLGPLALFFRDVKFAGGMPVTATVLTDRTTDPALVASLASDVRMQMITRLRRGNVNTGVYERLLVGMTSIRAIDCWWHVLDHITLRNYTKLTHLYGFSYETCARILDRPQLDRVRYIELSVNPVLIDELLELLVADRNLARVPRHLAFVSRGGLLDLALQRRVLAVLPDLPCTGVTIGDVTIQR